MVSGQPTAKWRTQLRWVRRGMWVLFALVCLVHLLADGRAYGRIHELTQNGMTPEDASKTVQSLCGPLNISAGLILAAIVVTGIADWAAQRLLRGNSSR